MWGLETQKKTISEFTEDTFLKKTHVLLFSKLVLLMTKECDLLLQMDEVTCKNLFLSILKCGREQKALLRVISPPQYQYILNRGKVHFMRKCERAPNDFWFIFIIKIIKQNFESIYFCFVCNAYNVKRSHFMKRMK